MAASKLARKLRERATAVESVNPYKVFDRDGWKCRCCGIDTPLEKRGSYAPDAPELDHIRPLSKGGGHTYKNTQLLCRQCNADKSDTWHELETT